MAEKKFRHEYSDMISVSLSSAGGFGEDLPFRRMESSGRSGD